MISTEAYYAATDMRYGYVGRYDCTYQIRVFMLIVAEALE